MLAIMIQMQTLTIIVNMIHRSQLVMIRLNHQHMTLIKILMRKKKLLHKTIHKTISPKLIQITLQILQMYLDTKMMIKPVKISILLKMLKIFRILSTIMTFQILPVMLM